MKQDELITRQEAKARGLTRYITGKPCKHGHVDERLTSNKTCSACNRIKVKAHRTKRSRDPVYRAKLTKYKVCQYAKRLRRDHLFKLQHMLRGRFSRALKGNFKAGSAVRDLGCSIEFLRSYLEERFEPGMAWENRGPVWHIDHRIPLAAFDLTKREQLLTACHYSNLQPLFVEDNLKKGAAI